MRGEVPGLQSPYKSTHFRHRPISGAKNEPQLNASMSSLAGRILKSLSTKSRMVKAIPTKRFTHSAVQALIEKDNLVVKASDHVDQYPLVWLRDNCTCEKCYHKDSQSRIINWNDFNIDVNIKSIKTNGDNKIEIDWDDDHRSIYNFDWLKKRSFKRTVQEKYLADSYLPEKILWDKKDFFDVIKTYQYDDVMNDDESHYNWLRDLAVYGVSLIENAPPNPGECRKLSEKVAFIRKTHYGEDFHVMNKPGTQNVAYLTSNLQLHTDLPYYSYNPGANLLHCIVQVPTKGGENMLTDIFYVAEKLRVENKEVFDILTQTDINWLDIGEEDGITFHKILRTPMISLDKEGKVCGVRHSIPQRDSHFTVELENVKPWYKAFKTFVTMANAHAAMFKLKPGDILAFDNTRLVHGRLGYEDTDDIKRHLVGHFIDWDEIYSRMRVLKRKLGKATFY